MEHPLINPGDLWNDSRATRPPPTPACAGGATGTGKVSWSVHFCSSGAILLPVLHLAPSVWPFEFKAHPGTGYMLSGSPRSLCLLYLPHWNYSFSWEFTKSFNAKPLTLFLPLSGSIIHVRGRFCSLATQRHPEVSVRNTLFSNKQNRGSVAQNTSGSWAQGQGSMDSPQWDAGMSLRISTNKHCLFRSAFWLPPTKKHNTWTINRDRQTDRETEREMTFKWETSLCVERN